MKSAPTDEDGQAHQSGEDGLVAPELHLRKFNSRSEVRASETRGKHRRRCLLCRKFIEKQAGGSAMQCQCTKKAKKCRLFSSKVLS